jgi:glycosyltransferase involved in cell wall biosynthesis
MYPLKKSNPLISVIVPVYNVEMYLAQCLESIMNQTYIALEIIVVDDGSTDRSGCICDAYAQRDERIRVIHQCNAGLGPARNKGLTYCSGEYITFVDSDDFLNTEMIESLYHDIRIHDADISICSYTIYNDISTERTHPLRTYQPREYCQIKDFLRDFFTPPVDAYVWGKLYRTILFQEYRFETIAFEDVLMWVPICKQVHKVVVGNRELYHYRRRPGSISEKGRFDKRILDLRYVWGKVGNELSEYDRSLQKIGKANFYSYAYFSILNTIILSNSEKEQWSEVRNIQTHIKCHLFAILKNPYSSLKIRIGSLIIAVSIRLYILLFRIRAKKDNLP